MSLFSALLHLKSDNHEAVEDFSTEILASVFRAHPDLLFQWLRAFGIDCQSSSAADVRTQVRYKQLEGHQSSRRPDMQIILTHQTRERDLIIVEAKVGAQAGVRQLEDYSEHLAMQQGFRSRTLVYLTHRYDPKQETTIRSKRSGALDVVFKQGRWSQIYSILSNYRSYPLVLEALSFMDDQGLSIGHRFLPSDLTAMMGFARSRAIMDMTIWPEIWRQFQSVAGKTLSKSRSVAMTRLRDRNQYIIYNYTDNWLVGVGYFMKRASEWNSEEYPRIGFVVEVGKRHPEKGAIESFLVAFAEKRGRVWETESGRDFGGCTAYYWVESMNAVLAGDDHVESTVASLSQACRILDQLRTESQEAGLAIHWYDRVKSDSIASDESEEMSANVP